MSAEAAREAAVACAAAHALLASHSAEPLDEGSADQAELHDAPPDTAAPEEVADVAAEPPAVSEPAIVAEPAPPLSQERLPPLPASSLSLSRKLSDNGEDSPELPSLSLRRKRAAFDEGDPLAHIDTESPRDAKPGSKPAVVQANDDDDDDDDHGGFHAKPSAAFVPSKKTLAMSLD